MPPLFYGSQEVRTDCPKGKEIIIENVCLGSFSVLFMLIAKCQAVMPIFFRLPSIDMTTAYDHFYFSKTPSFCNNSKFRKFSYKVSAVIPAYQWFVALSLFCVYRTSRIILYMLSKTKNVNFVGFGWLVLWILDIISFYHPKGGIQKSVELLLKSTWYGNFNCVLSPYNWQHKYERVCELTARCSHSFQNSGRSAGMKAKKRAEGSRNGGGFEYCE